MNQVYDGAKLPFNPAMRDELSDSDVSKIAVIQLGMLKGCNKIKLLMRKAEIDFWEQHNFDMDCKFNLS